ncbi:serine hydrolase [Desulfosporosinus sp. FKA]|uniref:serine hydrolase n=1 Tax=Desulfosporosinus sp. FKA TaxID=1969834 RepID=UPI00155324FF|nr:serine hydrolase [Desulfosporosinus sp. FKA]
MMLDNNNDFINDANNLCMGCMQLRGQNDQCLNCNWVEGTLSDSPLYLPPRTELNNRYVIGRVLGHGGFGITYLGWDQELHLKVAIKEYLPDGLGTRALGNKTVSVFSGQNGQDYEYGLEKFLAEARTLARFQSNPNIVSIMNFFKENGTAYIVMEYVEGISLSQLLQNSNKGRMPLDEALTYIMPIADALSLVHAEGVLHRDISPDNIYITKNYQVKLLDFGASRKIVNDVNKSLSVLLKPGYAPIEQYTSRGVQGSWTDEYSLAATFYKLLSGKTPPESIDRMQGIKLESLVDQGVNLPSVVESVIFKALAIQPQDRFQNIDEFKAELNKALSIGTSPANTVDKATNIDLESHRSEQKIEAPVKNSQAEGGGNQNTGPASLNGSQKLIIVLVAALILVIPATIYGIIKFNRPKPADRIVDSNQGNIQANNTQVNNNQSIVSESGNQPISTPKITDKQVSNRIVFSVLENIVRQDSKGSYFMYLRDNTTKEEYANSEANDSKVAGGLVYIPIMTTVLIEHFNGNLNLDKLITVQGIAGGTGKLTRQDSGRSLSIKQLLELMMRYSDNTAANLLIDELGGLERINKTMRSLNIDGIVLNRKLMDQQAMNRGLENYCSPRGIGSLLSLLAENRIMAAQDCEYSISIMGNNDHTGMAKYLPDNILISHQTGILTGVFNDAGIINTPKGRVVLVLMGEKVDQDTATEIFGKVARAVVEQIQK